MSELSEIANARTGVDLLRSVEQLAKTKTLSRVCMQPEFSVVIREAASFLGASDSTEAWSAAAAFGRIATVAQTLVPDFGILFRKHFRLMPAELPSLDNASNRRYAIAALRISEVDWRVGLLSRVAALEVSAEKVREEALRGLLEAVPNVATALNGIDTPFGRFCEEPSSDAATIAKHLQRILRGVCDVWSESCSEPGPRFGLTLALLVETPFRRHGPPPRKSKGLCLTGGATAAGLAARAARWGSAPARSWRGARRDRAPVDAWCGART